MISGYKTHAATGALLLLASTALAQSAADGPPCSADPAGPACQACIAEIGADSDVLGLVCYGGDVPPLPQASALPQASLTSMCAMTTCSSDLSVYKQCIELAQAYSESGAMEALAARKNELTSRRTSYEEACAPDALPALLADAEQQLASYAVFNLETNKRWGVCLAELSAAAAVIVDDANLADNTRGTANNAIRRAERVVDDIPGIIGSTMVGQTFVVGENLSSLTAVIRRNALDCEN